MKRIPHSPLALLLALALAGSAQAEEFRTSAGLHSLRPLSTVSSESQLRQSIVAAERMLQDQLTDIAAAERARSGVGTGLTGLPSQVKAEQQKVDAAKLKFEQKDRDYRAKLDAFTQKQQALDAETARQISEASAVQALPSAQRDWATVERLNKWADDIANRRKGFTAERDALLTEHAAVEAERQNVEKLRLAAEAGLKQQRDGSVGKYGSADAKVEEAYKQLQAGIRYTEQARSLLQTKYGRDPAPSPSLERANTSWRIHQSQRAR